MLGFPGLSRACACCGYSSASVTSGLKAVHTMHTWQHSFGFLLAPHVRRRALGCERWRGDAWVHGGGWSYGTRALLPAVRCLAEGLARGLQCEASADSAKYRRKRNITRAKGAAKTDPPYSLGFGALSGLPFTDSQVHTPFKVLGIETSCDDTAAAVVTSSGQILSNVVINQHNIHSRFGGVVPGLARDAHASNVKTCVEQALKHAGLASPHELDAIAVTLGPGLEICLRIGFTEAQALAKRYQKPFVCVHHLEAHCLVARLAGTNILKNEDEGNHVSKRLLPHFAPRVDYPFLALLASGGHTQLMLVEDMGKYTLLGGTLDDALGEAFDKAARMLNVPTDCGMAGGAAIEKMALSGDRTKFKLPIPMKQRKDCDLSYAGLKNAFRLLVNEQKAEVLRLAVLDNPGISLTLKEVVLPDQTRSDLAAAFQHTAFAHLEEKLRRAMYMCEDMQLNMDALVVVGGVAANQDLRQRLQELAASVGEWRAVFPPPELCTDNGVMCAWAGVEKLLRGLSDPLDGEVRAKWPLGMLLTPAFDT